jgi:hypothetical protein
MRRQVYETDDEWHTVVVMNLVHLRRSIYELGFLIAVIALGAAFTKWWEDAGVVTPSRRKDSACGNCTTGVASGGLARWPFVDSRKPAGESGFCGLYVPGNPGKCRARQRGRGRGGVKPRYPIGQGLLRVGDNWR